MSKDKKIEDEIEPKEDVLEVVQMDQKTEKVEQVEHVDREVEVEAQLDRIEVKEEKDIDKEKGKNADPVIKTYKKGIVNGLLKKIIIALIIIGFISTIVAFFAFRIDGIFFPSTLNVIVLDHNDEPMKDVTVFVDGKQVAKTNEEGKFTLVKGYGKYQFVFRFANFDDLLFTIDVQRGTNEIKVNMKPNGIGDVLIKFLPTTDKLNTDNLTLEFDSKFYELSEEGELIINKFPIGQYKLKVSSPYYYDVYSDVEVKAGDNISQIQLANAWDVNFKILDWISARPIEGARVSLEGFKFESHNDGYVVIKDLTKTTDVQVTVVKDKYLNKTININSADRNSDNEIKIEMVREGKVIYISNRTGNLNIYAANYDGTGEIRLSDNKGDNAYPQKIAGTKTVRFLSTRDNVKNAYSQYVDMPYSVNLDGTQLTKLSKSNYADYNSIGVYNFISMKRAFQTYKYDQATNMTTEYIYFGNIDGLTSTMLLEKINFTFGTIVISNNGDSLAFYGSDRNNDIASGVYTLNTKSKELKKINASKEPIELVSYSPDQSKVLGIINDTTSDLVEVNLSTQKIERLTNSSTVESSPLYLNPTTIVYMSVRDGKRDIYSINIAKKTETKLTTNGDVSDYQINDDGVILFYSNRVLWALDPAYPSTPKRITDNVISSADLNTGY
jgi:hypothetical protein